MWSLVRLKNKSNIILKTSEVQVVNKSIIMMSGVPITGKIVCCNDDLTKFEKICDDSDTTMQLKNLSVSLDLSDNIKNSLSNKSALKESSIILASSSTCKFNNSIINNSKSFSPKDKKLKSSSPCIILKRVDSKKEEQSKVVGSVEENKKDDKIQESLSHGSQESRQFFIDDESGNDFNDSLSNTSEKLIISHQSFNEKSSHINIEEQDNIRNEKLLLNNKMDVKNNSFDSVPDEFKDMISKKFDEFLSKRRDQSFNNDVDENVEEEEIGLENENIVEENSGNKNEQIDTKNDRQNSNIRKQNHSKQKKKKKLESSSSSNESEDSTLDSKKKNEGNDVIRLSEVYDVEKTDSSSKRLFCCICKKTVFKLARHLVDVHGDHEELEEVLKHPIGSKARKDEIALLRNKGRALYNSKFEYHKGTLQSARRRPANETFKSDQLEYCVKCKGYYTINSLRNHICIKADKVKIPGPKNLVKLGRQKFLHSPIELSQRMREGILPSLRKTEYAEVIKKDPLILTCGEYFCKTHPESRHNDLVARNLRYFARYLIQIKEIDETIKDFAMTFDSKYYKSTIAAIQKIGDFNAEEGEYKIPSNATLLTCNLIKACDIYETEIIQSGDTNLKKSLLPVIQEYKILISKRFGSDVNKTATVSYAKSKQNKKIEFASDEDLEKFSDYLYDQSKKLLSKLKKLISENKFCYATWITLAEVVLIGIIMFNRRRPGESERIKIKDFEGIFRVTKSHSQWKSLSTEDKKQAQKYGRFIIVGKLYKQVPVLLDNHYQECFKVIIALRDKAGVPKKNPYVFGLPNADSSKNYHIQACVCLRKLTNKCGADNPELLRFTINRKHFATSIYTDGADDVEVTRAAKFMGHQKAVHEAVYQQSGVVDITKVSKNLERKRGMSKSKSRNESEVSIPHDDFSGSLTGADMDTSTNDTIVENNNIMTRKRKIREAYSSLNETENSTNDTIETNNYDILPKNQKRRKIDNTSNETYSMNKTKTGQKKQKRKNTNDSSYSGDSNHNSDSSDSSLPRTFRGKSSALNNRKKSKGKHIRFNLNEPEIMKGVKPRYADSELRIIMKEFEFEISIKRNPTNAKIREAQAKHPFLARKEKNAIRTYVKGIIDKPEKYEQYK